jgi:hypothetical protein
MGGVRRRWKQILTIVAVVLVLLMVSAGLVVALFIDGWADSYAQNWAAELSERLERPVTVGEDLMTFEV